MIGGFFLADDETNSPPPSKSKWIVLIDKTPRGPLEKEEIDLLIQQGVIRRNDLAILVDRPGEKASWNFLWTFPEFDRRKRDTQAPVPVELPPDQPDRRHSEPVKPIIESEVPSEVIDIKIEDLLLKSRPVESRSINDVEEKDIPQSNSFRQTDSARHQANRFTYWAALASTLLVAIGGISFFFNQHLSAPPLSHDLPSNEPRNASEEHLSTGSPLSGTTPVHRATAAVPAMPVNIPKARTDTPTPTEGLPPAEEEGQEAQGQGEVDEDGNLVMSPPAEEPNEEGFPRPSLPSRARRANNPSMKRRQPANEEMEPANEPEEGPQEAIPEGEE